MRIAHPVEGHAVVDEVVETWARAGWISALLLEWLRGATTRLKKSLPPGPSGLARRYWHAC